MSTPIQKTTYTYVVMHTADDSPEDIEHAMREAYDGHMVGLEMSDVTVDIPDNKVSEELCNLGNDGTFFDYERGFEEDYYGG